MTKYAAKTIEFRRNTTGITYVAVGQVTALDKWGSARDLIDASAYGDSWNDYVLGLQDGDEVGITLALDPANAQHSALKADYDAGLPKNFQVVNTAMTAPTRTSTFPALVTEFHEGGDRDGVHEVEITLKIVNPGVSIT
jgi:hypothetical protein